MTTITRTTTPPAHAALPTLNDTRKENAALLASRNGIDVPSVATRLIDERQVDALSDIIRKATRTVGSAYIGADLTPYRLAHLLIATGKVEVRS